MDLGPVGAALPTDEPVKWVGPAAQPHLHLSNSRPHALRPLAPEHSVPQRVGAWSPGLLFLGNPLSYQRTELSNGSRTRSQGRKGQACPEPFPCLLLCAAIHSHGLGLEEQRG